ncbi:hypothetical protein NKI86_20315 [Mesorhizobium sp. M0320]|uniref:hypothetical protein n=1 Tax=Mesorhizobium sp. M0320 TaxID=2956936 RepID=UPI00333DBBA9
MNTTIGHEGQGRPFDVVIWTRDYGEKPRQRNVDDWITEIQDGGSGTVLIRDTPFRLGPEALPRDLLVHTCLWCCNVVFIVAESSTLLPLVDLQEKDAEAAYGDAAKLADRPGVKHLILIVADEDAEKWRVFVEYHNPGVWICQIDTDGSKIVKVGAGDAFPCQPLRS